MATRKSGRTTPKKQEIAADLLALITTGQVGPGERLPTEADLRDTYGVTRPTVREAYDMLINTGRVEKRGLYGYYVRVVPERRWQLAAPDGDASTLVDPWTAYDAERGEMRQTVEVKMPRADLKVRGRSLAELLNLPDDGEVICRSAIRYLDNEPVELLDAYAPFDRINVPQFRNAADPAGAVEMFTQAGYRVAGFVDSWSARVPVEHEIDRLELPQATPLADLLRRVYFHTDAGRECLLVLRSIYRGDGAEFEYDVQA